MGRSCHNVPARRQGGNHAGQPEDGAGPPCFLASDASAFVTGQPPGVCGGVAPS